MEVFFKVFTPERARDDSILRRIGTTSLVSKLHCSVVLYRRENVKQRNATPPPILWNRATFQATALEADHTADSGTSPPVVLSRAAAEIVERSALAHGNPPTAVTFSEEFIQDTEAFFRVMDAVSLGRFLSDPDALFADIGNKTASVLAGSFSRKRVSGAAFSAAPSGARWNGFTKGFDRGVISGDRGMKGPASGLSHGMEEWVQCPWLVGMGGFGLAAFLANRCMGRKRWRRVLFFYTDQDCSTSLTLIYGADSSTRYFSLPISCILLEKSLPVFRSIVPNPLFYPRS